MNERKIVPKKEMLIAQLAKLYGFDREFFTDENLKRLRDFHAQWDEWGIGEKKLEDVRPGRKERSLAKVIGFKGQSSENVVEECKSWNHTYKVGDQVFDLLSKQMVAILKIILVTDDYDVDEYVEELRSMKPSDEEDFEGASFIVTVNVSAKRKLGDADHDRIGIEFCLPEEAERYRGWDYIPSEEVEAIERTTKED